MTTDDEGVGHGQLASVAGALEQRREWRPGAAGAGDAVDAESWLLCRRLIGGSVDPHENKKVCKIARRSCTRVAEASLRVCLVGKEAARAHIKRLRDTLKQRRWLRDIVRNWRVVVDKAGPGATASRARIADASVATWQAISQIVWHASIDTGGLMQRAAGHAHSQVVSGLGGRACSDWFMLRFFCRWRAGMARRDGQRCAAWPELASVSQGVLGQPLTVVLEAESSAPGRRLNSLGVWHAVPWLAAARRARKVWARLGGVAAMEAERGARARARLARVRAAIFDPSATAAEVHDASRELEGAGLAGVRQLSRARRAIQNQMVDAGLRADGRGRWRVLDVVQWRGKGRDREGLVKWAGPHLPTWEPAARLTQDLRQEGRVKRVRVVPQNAANVGQSSAVNQSSAANRRVSPRLHGVSPSEGIA